MTYFDTVAIVDWSSGNDTGPRPRKDAIWAGVVRDGILQDSQYLRNRELAVDWLTTLIADELTKGRRLFLGFDFPFGYPSGFAKAVTGSGDVFAVWRLLYERLEDTPETNNRFHLAAWLNGFFPGDGPFWFNATKTDLPGLPRKKPVARHGLADRRVVERLAKGTFTLWQMGGAGAVGGQAMTGIAALEGLRRAFPDQIAVWPFEALDRPVAFVEVWPSLIAKTIAQAEDPIKDRAQVEVLARAIARLTGEDMARLLQAPAGEEGWIFAADAPTVLAQAAQEERA